MFQIWNRNAFHFQLRAQPALNSLAMFLGSLGSDLKFAFRLLRKSPVFFVVAVATLALGIGANTAMFSVLDAVLLKPLPFPAADRLTALWEAQADQSRIFISYRDLLAFQRESRSFEAIAGETWVFGQRTLRGHAAPRRVLALSATPNLFQVMGRNPEHGRTFTPADGDACLLVFSHKGWREIFSGDPHAVGAQLTLDNRPCTVIGVMPADFALYPRDTTLWVVPAATDPLVEKPKRHLWAAVGRMKSGISRDAARQDLNAIRVAVDAADPDQTHNVTSVVLPLQDEYVWLAGRNLSSGLKVLMAGVALVLLIACLNLANLLLARAAERRRELAVRSALGCTPARMTRQLLTETLLLAVIGAAAGLGVAYAALRYFLAANPIALPPGAEPGLDWHALIFTSLATLLAAVLCTLFPARLAARLDLETVLRLASRGSTARASMAGALVIAQVALSTALVIGAVLLSESALRFTKAPLGFDSQNLLSLTVDLQPPGYNSDPQFVAFAQRALDRLRALPGVSQAAISDAQPLFAGAITALMVEGTAPSQDEFSTHPCSLIAASPNYFRTMNVPLLAGRFFDDRDRLDSQLVAIANQALLRRYFPGAELNSVVGRRVKFGPDTLEQRWLTVVGVVSDVRQSDVFNEMNWAERPTLYIPAAQEAPPAPVFLLRTAGDPGAIGAAIPAVIAELDSSLVIRNPTTASETLAKQTQQPRFRAVLSSVLAALAALLAVLGLYGVLARQVAQRTQEIGIRMALGAQPANLRRSVIGRSLSLALAGIACGVIAALALGSYLASLLYEVKPASLPVLCTVAIGFALIALAAGYLPARRATRVDPVKALRVE
jgi:predicted permease